MTTLALLLGIFVGAFMRTRRRCRTDRRLGLLAPSTASTVAEVRVDRRRQLGEAGPYRVHNCGEILHLDYEGGELVVVVVARREGGA